MIHFPLSVDPTDRVDGRHRSVHDAMAGISPEAQKYYDQGLSYLHDYI